MRVVKKLVLAAGLVLALVVVLDLILRFAEHFLTDALVADLGARKMAELILPAAEALIP